MNKKEQEWTDQIRTDLSKLEDEERFPVPMPDLNLLENWVINQKQALKRKLIRELMLFWLIAFFILTAFVSIAYQKPLLLAYLQAPILFIAAVGVRRMLKLQKPVDRI